MKKNEKSAVKPKRIWIDLDNSPHVPFFVPIIKDLERRGYSVILTARDAYQVYELADFFGLTYIRVGRHYGKHRGLKVLGTCIRALQLLAILARRKPHLAVAHISRSQTIACMLLRIPSVAMFDYEFANTSAQSSATWASWVIVPEVIANSSKDFKSHNLLKYPGIKEDVYAPGFTPDPSIISDLGLESANITVTVRPPATEAHYHNPESDRLFEAVMEFLAQAENVKVVLLPRNSRQAVSMRKAWPDLFSSGKVTIPDRAVDGLNLIWHSDLVISGGGTMNREAAALGVPVFSIFRGRIGAVDRYLANHGRLYLLASVADVRAKLVLRRRPKPLRIERSASHALTTIMEHLVSILEGTARSEDGLRVEATAVNP
jgi:predicted glycosyltransferase